MICGGRPILANRSAPGHKRARARARDQGVEGVYDHYSYSDEKADALVRLAALIGRIAATRRAAEEAALWSSAGRSVAVAGPRFGGLVVHSGEGHPYFRHVRYRKARHEFE